MLSMLLPFLKNAGAKLFGKDTDKEKSVKVKKHLQNLGFPVDEIVVSVNDDKVTLSGEVASLDLEKKLLVSAGNVSGIKVVEDQLTVLQQIDIQIEPKENFYEVQKGDYLSKIAKRIYGNPMKYKAIFEANKPMLKDPDKIYPGQVLIIPSKTEV